MSLPTSTATSPFAALNALLKKDRIPPPYSEGWRTMDQCAKEMGMTRGSAKNRLVKARKAGFVETWQGYTMGTKGRLVRTSLHRIKPIYLPRSATTIYLPLSATSKAGKGCQARRR